MYLEVGLRANMLGLFCWLGVGLITGVVLVKGVFACRFLFLVNSCWVLLFWWVG